MSFPLENKTDDETVYSPSSLQPPPRTMPRKNSLRLLTTTPNTPVPPSLRTSPYLKSPVFNCGLASPTLPSEEDEKWLQDTIPLPSRHHEQVVGGQPPPSVDWKGDEIQLSRGGVTSGHMQRGAVPSPQPHHHRRHRSACESSRLRRSMPTPRTSKFVPPSILDANIGWQSAGLCRRWSTVLFAPQTPNKTFTISRK